jgi:uncharacterized protein
MADDLRSRLHDDLTQAMRDRDEVGTSVLRLALTAVTNAEVAGKEQVRLGDDQVLAVLAKEAKQRRESAQVYDDNGRAELAARERAELTVLERYLPAEVGDDELAAIVAEEVAAAAAEGRTGPPAMGGVVKAVRARVGPSTDGGKVAALVKAALTGG